MNETNYAKSITAEDLRIFLGFWPIFSADGDEVQQMLIENKDKFLGKGAEPFAWCYLYELPISQHLTLANISIIQGYAGFLHVEQVTDWYKQVVEPQGNIGSAQSRGYSGVAKATWQASCSGLYLRRQANC